MKTVAAFLIVAAASVDGAAAQTGPAKVAPGVDQILSLERVGSPASSLYGRMCAYTVRQTNWDDNSYDTQIWMADVASGTAHQLTSGKKSSLSPAWAPAGSARALM